MFKELELSETDSVLAAYNAVCELVEETERLQAACAAKEAELAELRGQTAELFGERVAAEGADDEAVHAAMAMWKLDPQNAAQAVLGCDIAEAANPYGCNQYRHEWRGPHGANWRVRVRGVEKKDEKQTEQNNGNKAKPYNVAPKKEIHVDNPKYKAEVNEHLRNVKTVAQQEKDVYDSITKGKLSSTELQNKLKEWRELQNKYYEVLDDFKNKNVGVNVIEQKEVYHTEVQTEDDIMRHYEEISKRYPDKVHAANPYGCNQYGHGFRQPHGAAGGRGQKTFDFFGETEDKKRKKDLAVVEDATRAFKAAREAEDTAYKKWNDTSYGTPEYKEAEAAWEKAYKKLGEEVKNARRVRNEARKEGYDLDEPVDKEIDELIKSMEEAERAWASSRTLEELLVEEDRVNAANPYGCNQYGHEWKGKHGEGWKPSGRGGKETQGEKGRDKGKEQKRDALGEMLVKTRREASQLLDEITEELNKQKKKENGLTPELINLYNLQGFLQQEMESFERYDSEKAAERLAKAINDLRSKLKKPNK